MNRAVLIIDDDIDFQLMVGNMLTRSGYIVKSLIEGKIEDALSIAKGCDIILLDIELPGVSGLVIGKELKSSSDTIHIPIILLSANDDAKEMFKTSHANAFFQKPFSLSGLMNKISELLCEKGNQSKQFV